MSIVTPSFNQADFIEETIRSVLLQNYPNLQYIVIDGGSTDGTREILERYSPWIDYWVSEKDRGQSHAINKGLERCDGEWFNWINSDDLLLQGALAALVRGGGADSRRRIVAGVTRNVRDGRVFGSYGARVAVDWPEMLFSLGVNQPGSLLRLEDVRACGGIREDLGLCMDLDLWLRILLLHGPEAVARIPDEVADYRYHSESKTCSAGDVFALEEFAILTDLAGAVGRVPTDQFEDLRACHASRRGTYTSSDAIQSGQAAKAYFDRLLVSDSLLFRGLSRAAKDRVPPFAKFQKLLNELRPWMLKNYPRHRLNEIEAHAMIRAMQQVGILHGGMGIGSIARMPDLKTLRELVRLAYRSIIPRKP